MSDTTLAALSNGLVYASMLAFTFGMFAFALSFGQGRGRSDASQSADTSAGAQVLAQGAAGSSVDVIERTAVEAAPGAEPGRRAGNVGMSLMWLATGLLLAAVVSRGLSAGRVPWGNMYEFSITSALGISAAFLFASLKADLRWLGLFVVVPVLLTLGAAVTVLYTDSAQLVPALKSWWLLIHVSAAIVCAGAFTLGAAVTVLYLAVNRVDKRVAAGNSPGMFASVARRVPSADRLDRLSYTVNAFVFPLWTFTVIAGAIWAESAWGRYWGWDPKETWAFITWVVYAAYLHARATAGWKGERAALIGLLGYSCFLFNYFGVNLFFAGLHSYSGVK